MAWDGMEKVSAALGGGTVGAGFLVYALRRIWRQYSAEVPETRKDQAEAALFENLRAEITRMGQDIKQIKEEHKAEKAELEARICELEEKVNRMTSRLTQVRRSALDAYGVGMQCECASRDQLLSHLKRIIDEE